MARRRKGRSVDGILLLNKPLGISSNQALQQVKRAFFAAKAGHTGALDPLATGMLPICLGEATKFSQFLLETDKTYLVTATLGVRTTTSDADGEIVATKPVNVSEAQLHTACEQFRGPIKQVPSMFSALKHQGKPLYFYARQGIEIDRPARDITIFSLSVTRFEGNEVDMQVHCSKGTYIRSLVDDIGQILDCGAYVSKLHRTQVTDYPSDKMVTLEQLDELLKNAQDQGLTVSEVLDPLLIAMDTAVKNLPEAKLNTIEAQYFSHGNPAKATVALSQKEGTQIRAYSESEGFFMGVGEVTEDGRIWPKRVVVRNEE
ncbi:MAG: tRNA pseudouridine55 synthase [Paraglaciecola sp.]